MRDPISETVEPGGGGPRKWIYYDAACSVCVSGVERWGDLFARRGFVWMPLQTPGAAARLGVSDEDLLAEMHLLLADGRVLRGADAWAAMLRTVWWLWPLGVLLSVPGFREVGRAIYRWVARNRYCVAGKCDLKSGATALRKRHHGATAFFEMP